jgi:NodT family efflux transporter outer membrane factor (OMF) lipoprotein
MTTSNKVSMFRKLFIVIPLFFMGCTTLGPDYVEPEIKWANEWEPKFYEQLGSQSPSTENDLKFWWSMFDDAVLNNLIKAAKKDNKSLQVLGLRILESQAQFGIVNSSLYPQVQNIAANGSYTNLDMNGGGLPSSNVTGASYSANANIGWEIDFWGKYKRSIESADASLLSTVASYHDMQVLLSAQVAKVYYQYRTLQLRISIANENVDIQKKSYNISRLNYESGQDSELDFQQAKTQYLGTVSAIPNYEKNLMQTRNALSKLLARPPGEILALIGEYNVLPTIEPNSIQRIPASYLIRRPDIRAAAYKVAAQSPQIGAAKADKYPSLSLFGTLGWTGGSLDSTQTIRTVGGGPSLTWDIFNYGRHDSNIRVQDARLQQLIEIYQDEVLNAAIEIDNATIDVIKTYERQGYLIDSVIAAKRSLEIANSRYREGYADFQRVLDAQRMLFTLSEKEIINHGVHVNSIISLYKALGGGWETLPINQIVPEETRLIMEERADWSTIFVATIPVKGASN